MSSRSISDIRREVALLVRWQRGTACSQSLLSFFAAPVTNNHLRPRNWKYTLLVITDKFLVTARRCVKSKTTSHWAMASSKFRLPWVGEGEQGDSLVSWRPWVAIASVKSQSCVNRRLTRHQLVSAKLYLR